MARKTSKRGSGKKRTTGTRAKAKRPAAGTASRQRAATKPAAKKSSARKKVAAPKLLVVPTPRRPVKSRPPRLPGARPAPHKVRVAEVLRPL